MDFIGSGTSSFQACPAIFDKFKNGEVMTFSDWEFEIKKNLAGKPSGIKTKQNPMEFPDFLNKYKQYIDRSRALGENMFRFSFEMARLCDRKEDFNYGHMAHLIKILAYIRAGGQEPFVTLNHFAMKKRLAGLDKNENFSTGAWENPDVIPHLLFCTQKIMECLGSRDFIREALLSEPYDQTKLDELLSEGLVKYFMSINEPGTLLGAGYVLGLFPPYHKGRLGLAIKVLGKMVEAHDMMRNELKTFGAKMQLPSGREPLLGVGYNWNKIESPLDLFHKQIDRRISDKFERDNSHSDFLGIQYYFRMPFPPVKRIGRDYGDHPDFGDIYPAGILAMLKKLNSAYPRKDIFISEMGFSDHEDLRRPHWISETMHFVEVAKKMAIPVKGVILWSLVNNFEWQYGMSQKFGLFDEKELGQRLIPSDAGGEQIRSWEMWSAIIKNIRHPSEEAEQELRAFDWKARAQYDERKSR